MRCSLLMSGKCDVRVGSPADGRRRYGLKRVSRDFESEERADFRKRKRRSKIERVLKIRVVRRPDVEDVEAEPPKRGVDRVHIFCSKYA